MSAGRASEAQAREEIDCLQQTAGWCAQDPEQTVFCAGRGVALRQSPLQLAFGFEATRSLTAEVCKLGKPGAAPLPGLFDASVSRKSAISGYEPDADLRDAAQMPLLEDGCTEASIRCEELPDGLLKGGKA